MAAARQVHYGVASSLDGYIAGPNGEADWITMDPDIDFAGIFAKFDTLLMGRRTFAGMGIKKGKKGKSPWGLKTLVFSRTLDAADYPSVTVVRDDAKSAIAALKKSPGKDIWLFGGGSLFRSLAEQGLVDSMSVAIVPIVLGGGIPLVPPGESRLPLTLTKHEIYPKSGIVSLEYALKK